MQGKLPLGVALEAPSKDMGGDLRSPPLQVTGCHKPVGAIVPRPYEYDDATPAEPPNRDRAQRATASPARSIRSSRLTPRGMQACSKRLI